MTAPANQDALRRPIPLLEHTLGQWNGIKQGLVNVVVTNTTHLVGRVDKAFNVRAWRDSIAALKSRHAVLASRVVDGVNGPEFVPGDCDDDPCTPLDISSETVNGTTAQEIVTDLVWRPFDVSREGLMRTFAVAVSESDVIVGIVVNHFVADLWSMEIIGRELLESYVAFASSRRTRYAAPAFQFLDYLADTRVWLQGAQARSYSEFWKREMANPPATRLPVDYHRDLDVAGNVAAEEFTIGPASVAALRGCAKSLGVTTFLLMLAAKMIAVSEASGNDDVVISTLMSGRDDWRWLNAVGLFANAVRVRTSVDRCLTFAEFVQKVRSHYVRAYAHQRYPDSLVRRELAANGVVDISPAFNFTKTNAARGGGHDQFAALRSLGIGPPPLGMCTPRDFPSHFLTVVDTGEKLYCGVSYLDVLYKAATFADFLKRFACILGRASQTPNTELRNLLQ